MKKKPIIGVIGQGGPVDEEILLLAEQSGKLIAQRGAMLVCGGLGGVMEAACRGAKSENGTTIGILPGQNISEANDFVDIPIATGLGEARNSIVVRSAEVIIAIGGRFGTLSEIGFALAFGKKVIGLRTWQGIDGIHYAENVEHAVKLAFEFII
ncbi:TIGR00725 family protein [candidate division KSB1 bacterium 4484_87]|nr:MAG: TIGR00725 family protein [candidate division KSB1 bacterium 4484_87]